MQFRRGYVLKEWLEATKNGRYEAHMSDNSVLGMLWKAVGNHGYGYGLLNLADRLTVNYCEHTKLKFLRNKLNSQGHIPAGPEQDRNRYWETSHKKTTVLQQVPKQLSADILSCAKIPLLEMVYKVFFKYFRDTAWSLVSTDTDSLIVMFAEEDLKDCCKPERKEDFEKVRDTIFAPRDGPNAKRLAMEPLMFKSEFRGHIAISQTSKSYM